jgi:hypothetical protein
MSEPDDPAENVLQRWSRRKRAAQTGARAGSEPVEPATAEAPPPRAAPPDQSDLPAFDPATLPSLESITAVSDIRAFLAAGVPEELTRAALRRAWAMDPAIRDFIGIAENQWDFTRPNEVPGFGSLRVTPELRRMVAQLVGDAPAKNLSRPDPSLERSDQPADKPSELPPAPARQAGTASANAVEHAPCEQEPAPEAASNAFALTAQADIDAAVQEHSGEMAAADGSAPRRHGGAVPR